MNTNIHPKSKSNDLVVQELAGEVLIYDLSVNKAFCLNQTAALIWQHADGEKSAAQIARILQKKLKMPVDESIVWLAIGQLEKDGLLETKVRPPENFAEINRRELVRKLGKTAAVALPLVLMISVPTAAGAASGMPDGSTCSNGAQCSGGGCLGSKCCTTAGASCAGAGSQCCGTLTCNTQTLTCQSSRPA